MKWSVKALENERAQQALDEIQGWQRKSGVSFGDVATRLKGLPVMIRGEGLITSLAILLKGTAEDKAVADALARWLKSCELWAGNGAERPGAPHALLETLVSMDNLEYRMIQREALAYVEHLKLLAEVWDNGGQ